MEEGPVADRLNRAERHHHTGVDPSQERGAAGGVVVPADLGAGLRWQGTHAKEYDEKDRRESGTKWEHMYLR